MYVALGVTLRMCHAHDEMHENKHSLCVALRAWSDANETIPSTCDACTGWTMQARRV